MHDYPADMYVTDDAEGDGWKMLLGDSCERMGELADDSVAPVGLLAAVLVPLHLQPLIP